MESKELIVTMLCYIVFYWKFVLNTLLIVVIISDGMNWVLIVVFLLWFLLLF